MKQSAGLRSVLGMVVFDTKAQPVMRESLVPVTPEPRCLTQRGRPRINFALVSTMQMFGTLGASIWMTEYVSDSLPDVGPWSRDMYREVRKRTLLISCWLIIVLGPLVSGRQVIMSRHHQTLIQLYGED